MSQVPVFSPFTSTVRGDVTTGAAATASRPILVAGRDNIGNAEPLPISNGTLLVSGPTILDGDPYLPGEAVYYVAGHDGTTYVALRVDASGRPAPATYTNAFTANSPAAPGTTLGAAYTIPGDTAPRRAQFQCRVRGATGGTLDIYGQTSIDGGTTWTDVFHLPQLAAGAALVSYAVVLDPAAAAAPLASLNTVDGTPTLAVNTVRNLVGTRFRLVFVAGAGTSAGASQDVKGLFSAA